MISQKEREALKFRAQSIIENLRKSTSGSEVHEVANITNVAQGILDVLNDEDDCEDLIVHLLKSIEAKQLEFFKKKFSYMSQK